MSTGRTHLINDSVCFTFQSFPLTFLILMTLMAVKCQKSTTNSSAILYPVGHTGLKVWNLVVHFQRCPFWLTPLRFSLYAEWHIDHMPDGKTTERRPAVSELCVTFHSSSSAGPSLSACNCQAAALLEPCRRWNMCAPVVAVVYLKTLRPVAQFHYNNFGPFYSLLQNNRPAVIMINSGEGKHFFRTEDDFYSHSQCFSIHSIN